MRLLQCILLCLLLLQHRQEHRLLLMEQQLGVCLVCLLQLPHFLHALQKQQMLLLLLQLQFRIHIMTRRD